MSAPSNIVSVMLRACSTRSVKKWPRSGSAAICTSSTAQGYTGRSSGIDLTVQTKPRAPGGVIFSSPVISATWFTLFSCTMRSEFSRASRRNGKPIMPEGGAEDALDCEIGLAGIGGAEDGGQAAGGAGERYWGTIARRDGGSKAGRRPGQGRIAPGACSAPASPGERVVARADRHGNLVDRHLPAQTPEDDTGKAGRG